MGLKARPKDVSLKHRNKLFLDQDQTSNSLYLDKKVLLRNHTPPPSAKLVRPGVSSLYIHENKFDEGYDLQALLIHLGHCMALGDPNQSSVKQTEAIRNELGKLGVEFTPIPDAKSKPLFHVHYGDDTLYELLITYQQFSKRRVPA